MLQSHQLNNTKINQKSLGKNFKKTSSTGYFSVNTVYGEKIATN